MLPPTGVVLLNDQPRTMQKNLKLRGALLSGLTVFMAALTVPVAAQQPTAAERAAALKATIMASQVILRQYEWVETTVVAVNGEEKSRKQQKCYYGADGKVQKVVLSESAPPPQTRGFFRRRIAERKQDEMKDYMKEAIGLVRQYMPPDQARIQAAKDAGNVAVQLTDPGKRARLTFSNYIKSGDSLSVDVDLTNNHPLAANVSSFMDSDNGAVTLAVQFGTLNDGTTYNSQTVLNAPAKNLTVTVDNSGYRKSGQ
jgi:hypothetical protein